LLISRDVRLLLTVALFNVSCWKNQCPASIDDANDNWSRNWSSHTVNLSCMSMFAKRIQALCKFYTHFRLDDSMLIGVSIWPRNTD